MSAILRQYALVLWVIEELVRLSDRLPGAFLTARFAAAWVGPVALTALMAVLMAGYAHDWKRARGGWWPPFVVVAVVLLFGVKFG